MPKNTRRVLLVFHLPDLNKHCLEVLMAVPAEGSSRDEPRITRSQCPPDSRAAPTRASGFWAAAVGVLRAAQRVPQTFPWRTPACGRGGGGQLPGRFLTQRRVRRSHGDCCLHAGSHRQLGDGPSPRYPRALAGTWSSVGWGEKGDAKSQVASRGGRGARGVLLGPDTPLELVPPLNRRAAGPSPAGWGPRAAACLLWDRGACRHQQTQRAGRPTRPGTKPRGAGGSRGSRTRAVGAASAPGGAGCGQARDAPAFAEREGFGCSNGHRAAPAPTAAPGGATPLRLRARGRPRPSGGPAPSGGRRAGPRLLMAAAAVCGI